MTVTLPPPILSQHPAPWWCPTCGQLEAAGCNHRRRAVGVLGRLEVPRGGGGQLAAAIEGPRCLP